MRKAQCTAYRVSFLRLERPLTLDIGETETFFARPTADAHRDCAVFRYSEFLALAVCFRCQEDRRLARVGRWGNPSIDAGRDRRCKRRITECVAYAAAIGPGGIGGGDNKQQSCCRAESVRVAFGNVG